MNVELRWLLHEHKDPLYEMLGVSTVRCVLQWRKRVSAKKWGEWEDAPEFPLVDETTPRTVQ